MLLKSLPTGPFKGAQVQPYQALLLGVIAPHRIEVHLVWFTYRVVFFIEGVV